jgi:hypothetical protein
MIIVIASVIILGIVGLSASPSRQRKLKNIIADLQGLASKPEWAEKQYAIRENVAFFQSLRSLPTYLYWGIRRRPNVVAEDLLEIADLPLPHCEKELYQDLTHIERKKFPGLSTPLKKLLLSNLREKPTVRFLELGCGSMEVGRQVLEESLKSGATPACLFLGIDTAAQAWEAIQANFADFKIGRAHV